jgi:DNA polymerase III delta prime subunit
MTTLELLADKCKPINLEQFQLDSHTYRAIRTLVEMNNVNVLLYGSPCCGKTTLIDILVREYYGPATAMCAHPAQIMYINNLKEQGVRYYRTEMKSFCKSVSIIPGKKKLVIIDDLDNINEQSQQVFRNYLDTYESTVCFITVCTNLQKVIENIQSRVHIIPIKPLTPTQIKTKIEQIVADNHIPITPEVRDHMLRLSSGVNGGSIKTAINCLEKIRILTLSEIEAPMTKIEAPMTKIEAPMTKIEAPMTKITHEVCERMCSTISRHHMEQYLRCLQNGHVATAIAILFEVWDSGYSVIDILDGLHQFTKTTDLLDELTKYSMIPIVCHYITIFYNMHEDKIELALLSNSLSKIFIPC